MSCVGADVGVALGEGGALLSGVADVVGSGVGDPVHPTAASATSPVVSTARIARPCIRMPGRYRFAAVRRGGFSGSVDGPGRVEGEGPCVRGARRS